MPVQTATKLALYNGALRRLGSRELASLTEAREPRRVLDGVWGAANEIVLRALEAGDWNFAIRAVMGTASASVEPPFGLAYAFEKPSDLRRLLTLCSDEAFSTPLTDREYVDEADYWFSDLDTIYVRYISDDGAYGLNDAGWSEAFKDYLECDLAARACERITNSGAKRDLLERDRARALKTAKANDAMAEGVKFPPRGSWALARGGARSRLA